MGILDNNNKEVPILDILSVEKLEQVRAFLSSLNPRISSDTWTKHVYVERYWQGSGESSRKIMKFSDDPSSYRNFADDSWLPIEATLHQTKCRRLRGFDDQWSNEFEFSSDSNVYLLKWWKYIVKFYFSLWVEEIKIYHEFQNKLAKDTYTIEWDWEIWWDKFSRIVVNILHLPTETIIWTRYSSMSFIECARTNLTNDVSYDRENLQEIADKAVDEIWRKHQFNEPKPKLSYMNIQLWKIENGTLYITITDIWNCIDKLLENIIKHIRIQNPRLQDLVKWRISSLISWKS